MVGSGYYNKDRNTVSIEEVKKVEGESAAEIVKDMRNKMEKLKRETPRGSTSLNPIKLKRGPKVKGISKK